MLFNNAEQHALTERPVSQSLAPVLVFAYNRPHHLRQTLAALAANHLAEQTDCIIYCDGPATCEMEILVGEVRSVAWAAKGFRSLKIIERDQNMGLAASIVDGVSNIVAIYDRVIVVEDDLVTSPHFLRYMNDGLDLYADNPRVASIHGWCFPHNVENPPETFFVRGADCWGWGTWRRAWQVFRPDARELLYDLKQLGLERAFNCDDNYDFVGMLRKQRDGEISSWAIRWHAATFLANMYTLNPSRSLVQNIGLDGSGAHCSPSDMYIVTLANTAIGVQPVLVKEAEIMRNALNDFYRSAENNGPNTGLSSDVRRTLKSLIPLSLIRILRRARGKF